ncbi:MAG: stage II sporulation protein M [Sphingobacteriales bacterium]|nr:MAG: stage II sporulation protein M [Sphingobacteriales bacterium]
MREPAFVKQNAEKWKRFEELLNKKAQTTPDELAGLFIQITDDLSYSKTFYPDSQITKYLNALAAKAHQSIYVNKREDRSRIFNFWKYELPFVFYRSRWHLFYSFLIFSLSVFIGVISSANDDTFIRLILGDSYVNMTLDNISRGDPMAVYKESKQTDMFMGITFNNVRVSFLAFAAGVFFSFGTAYILFFNGVMVGAFQYMFYEQGLFMTSFLTIWIHGTLEISAIVIAGCAGLAMGNSILFPQTFSRLESFRRGAKQGLKIIIGLIPVFITAGFLESFVTRATDLPDLVKSGIILTSLAFIIWYFIVYPHHLQKTGIPKNVFENLPD